MGVATGCGCKEVYRFPRTTYPYSSCICSFCSFFKCFSFLFQYFFKITFEVFSRSINTYRQLRASHGIHMKAAHTVLYMKKHTQAYASYPAMDISCMSLVEGVRYNYRDASRAVRVRTGPASLLRSRDLELEGGVIACHVDDVYEPQDSHVRGTK